MLNRYPYVPYMQQQGYKPSETRKAIDHYSYALNEEIGRGFSSKVYRGRDEANQQPVAVKVIDMKMVKQSIHSVLLKNEISALKSFNCKNILQLYDVFQTQNNTYIITELCDSGDLHGVIKRRGKVDEQEAIRIIGEVASGLLEMNKKGYIHRDIKPANILIDKNVPKIADFGFAVQINSTDVKSQGKHYNVGTPLYMSPQALRQQGHTEKGDVWAMGIMYYELLFGRTPFTAQSESALISSILHTQLQIPAIPPVSELSKDFIRRCLQVEESRRMKVKELASHALVSQSVERNHFRSQPPNNEPIQYIQKEKRSHSQGLKDYQSRPIRQQPQQNVRSPTELYQIQQPQIQIVDAQVARSKSQKQIVELKQSPPTGVLEENNDKNADENYKRSSRRPHTLMVLKQDDSQQQINNNSIPQSPLKFKSNNDILFSQINYCRYLYKFSQQLASSKNFNQLKLTPGLKDKILFLMAKNIAIKITKLSFLNEKENIKENSFQLDDLEVYKRSDSFSKFSQAIWEYNEKYMKHFDKIHSVASKQNLTTDKKFEALFDKDFTEFESFYFITQTYLKQALSELKFDIHKIIDERGLDNLDSLNQFIPYAIECILGYSTLITHTIESMNDVRKFVRSAKVEQMVDRRQSQKTYQDLEDLRQQIQDQLTR